MIRLLQLIFLGHWHKWKTVETRPLRQRYVDGDSATGTRYIQQCEGCGKVIKRDLIG